ncbi:helix-turn-helix domain-containing protein [Enterococcus termitis]
MRELLDSKSKKRVAVIEKIFYSSNHICTQSELLEQLDMTYPTLLSVIDGINNDVVRFGYSDFSISRHSHPQSYSININKSISIQLLVHAYIRESSKFQLLELLLTSSFPNLQLLSKSLYISYNSLRKDIKELNQFLKKNGIKISAKEGVRLEGDEIGIRLFYTFLYLNVYGGDSWYFRLFSILRLLEYWKIVQKKFILLIVLIKVC